MPGTLSVIATPIGNLEDLTLRALRTLRECDVVLCEDTRVTKKILAAYKIPDKQLVRFDAYATERKYRAATEALREGAHVAFVTDAGTPGVSDPGNLLVADVVRAIPGVRIEPIPGPSALTALASVCGLPTDHFLFLGFLPLKQRRRKVLERIVQSPETAFFFESPYRIVRTLEELAPLLGDRLVVVGRELTKRFETISRGTAAMLHTQFLQTSGRIRGELVIAVEGKRHHHSASGDTEE